MNNLKNYKTKLISYLLIFVLIFTLFPFGIVKAEEISGEHFILNNTTIGDKGTMPVVNNSKFIKDRTGKYVLDAGSENRVVYDLGISSSGGTVGTWFKSHTRSKYIIASTDDKNDAILDMYINIDGKLEVAVRDNNTNWKIVVTSSEIVKLDVWNYASVKWTISDSTLNCTLFLNDNKYMGSTSDFKDFTGAKTGIGCYPASSYNIPLVGAIHDFVYYDTDIDDNLIVDNMNKTNLVGSYEVETFSFNGSTSGDKGTMPIVNNATFLKDESEKYVLDAGSANRVVYDLGISSSGGMMGTWFKSHTTGKYIIASTDDKNDAILDMYINNDGKLELAVRGNNTMWKVLVTSSEIVKLDEWNYASIKWTLSGSTLNCTLSLNDNEYTGSTCDFKDFTGAKTGIGCYPASSYNIPLMGLIRDFTYREVDATNERIEAAIPLEKNDWNPLSNTWKDVIGKINYKYDENWYYVDVSDINKYLNVVLELPENPSDRSSGMENYDVDLYSFNNGVKKVLATSRSNYSIEYINYKVEQPGRYYIRVYSNRGDSDTEIAYTLKTDLKPIIKPYGGEFQGWDYLGYGTKVNPSIPIYLDSSIDEAKVIDKDEEGKEHFYSDIVNNSINIWNKADISGRPKYRDGTPMNIFNLQSSSLFANTIYLFNR